MTNSLEKSLVGAALPCSVCLRELFEELVPGKTDKNVLPFKFSSIRRRSTRSNASVIIRRLEEVSLHPIPHTEGSSDAPGLPSYEQAIAITGPHDAPPPPYPGYQHTISFDVFPYVTSVSFFTPLLCHLVVYYHPFKLSLK